MLSVVEVWTSFSIKITGTLKLICFSTVLLVCFNGFSQDDSLAVQFDTLGGLYTKGLDVALTLSSAEGDIFYTLDGSVPTSKSKRYKKPITLDTTTVVRAISYVGKQKSIVYTQSYIIENRAIGFPVISIAVDPDDFLDPVRGLYVKGPNAAPNPPYRGANYHKDKELPIHVTYFTDSGDVGFSQLAGLKIYGAYSRMFPQKSLAIISRSDYGKRNFDYPLYPDLPFKKYKSFILRNSGTDNNKAHFRDVMMTQLVKDLSFDIQSYRTCIVYINGKYWGIYHIREKLNEHYLKQHYKLEKDSVTIMKHRADLKIGKSLNYGKVLAYINKTNFKDNRNIDSLNKFIDINNFLDYNIAQTYFANTDAGGNIRFWRSWNDTSRWRWLMFDTDFGFGLDGGQSYKRNTIVDFTKASNEKWPYPAWSTLFIRKLLQNDSIQGVYINKFSHFLNTIFDPVVVDKKRAYFENKLSTEIDYHHKRWGSNRKNWENHVNRIKAFGKNRPYYIKQHLATFFDLDTVYPITIKPAKNGAVILNGYTIDSNFTGNYYGGVIQDVKAKPAVCFEFVKWKNRTYTNANLVFKLSQPEVFEPVFRKKPKSERYKQVIFSEFSIKGGKDVGDWVELFNTTSDSIELSGWFIQREDGNTYTIPKGTVIKPNGYLVISRNKYLVDSLYELNSVDGFYSIKDTSTLSFYDANERLIDSLHLSFDGKEHIDVNTITGVWDSNKKYTPGDLNASDITHQQVDILIYYILYPFLGLVFLISLIFAIKYFRPHSSTE